MEIINYNKYIVTFDNDEDLLNIDVLSELTFKQYNIQLSTEDLFEISNRLFNTNLLFNILLDGLNKTNDNIDINIRENIDRLLINVIYDQSYDPYEFSICITNLQNENTNLDRVLCEYNTQQKTIKELQSSLYDLQTNFDNLVNTLCHKNIFTRMGNNYCIIPSNDTLIRMDQTELISWGNKVYIWDCNKTITCTYNKTLNALHFSVCCHTHKNIIIHQTFISYGVGSECNRPYLNIFNNCMLSWHNEDELQFMNSLKNIKKIVLAGNLVITNLSFMSCCTTLEHLTLDECYNLSDITALEKLINLKTISLLGCDKVNDISALANMDDLETLNVERSGVDSTICLGHLTKVVITS